MERIYALIRGMDMNTTTALEMNALRIPDEVCLEFGEKNYTWKELDELANRYAKGFADRGIRRGDHIAVLMKNSDDFVVISYAIWKVGAVLVPIHYLSATPEVTYILQHANIVAFIFDDVFMHIAEQALSQLEQALNLVVHRGDQQHPQFSPLASLCATSIKPVGTHIEDSHFAEILYTQGTTGKPKGALFTHSQVMDTAFIYERLSQMTRQDSYLVSVPLCHGLSLNAIMLMAALVGGKLVIQEHFDASEILTWMQTRKITHFFGVPSMYHALVEQAPVDFSAPDLRVVSYGAAPMPVPLIDRAMALFSGAQFFNIYGTTESGPTGLMLLPSEHHQHKGKTGKAMPLTAVRLVNEYMEDVPQGTQGEIIIKSPTVMTEYYKDPAATFTMKKNGWLFTGDLATEDKDGYMTIVGRKDNTILSGGETVYAVDIEHVLLTHPAVQEAVIMGIPDQVWGEIVAVTIVPNPGKTITEQELVAYCKTHLASYKIPKKFLFMDELPRSTSGKILKDHLKETLKK